MAGQHLKDLIAAYGSRDDLQFRRAAQAIIHEEEAKKHTVLARDLKMLLISNSAVVSTSEPAVIEPPMDRDSSTPLATVTFPKVALQQLVLDPAVSSLIEGFIDEIRRWPELDIAGVPRRNRVLLYGPPGCGKTSTVEAMAAALGRPLVTARVDGLMSSYLGETASNLRKLFDYANSGPYVLLLDEFDSLGKLRDDPTDHGELRRVVNAVLQLIDAYSGPSIIVAATNHPDILDAALWRRFDVVTELPLPTDDEIRTLLYGVLRGRGEVYELESIARKLSGLPHAAAEFAAHSALRRSVLDRRPEVNQEDLIAAVAEAIGRRWV
jgi:SpoVK/Ycf46/Vps4 family AAA+-type ATPase